MKLLSVICPFLSCSGFSGSKSTVSTSAAQNNFMVTMSDIRQAMCKHCSCVNTTQEGVYPRTSALQVDSIWKTITSTMEHWCSATYQFVDRSNVSKWVSFIYSFILLHMKASQTCSDWPTCVVTEWAAYCAALARLSDYAAAQLTERTRGHEAFGHLVCL